MRRLSILLIMWGNMAMAAESLTLRHTVGDLLSHPAFQGFGERMLTRDNRTVPKNLPLSDVAELMPYHSHIRPDDVVATLNKMIARREQGETLFYDIYSETEKRRDPSKRHTGVFVFHAKDNAPFAMIAAGGGFAYVGSLHEGFPIAEAVAEQGYNAFVVKYRVGLGGQIATEDMAQAVEFVRKNAKMLKISADNYSVWGGSAGARMAAYLGSYGTAAFGTQTGSKPATVVMLYTGHSDIGQQEPPTFAAVGEYDGIASPAVMQRRIVNLKNSDVKTEFHLYPELGHGFALGNGTSAQGWVTQAVDFWR